MFDVNSVIGGSPFLSKIQTMFGQQAAKPPAPVAPQMPMGQAPQQPQPQGGNEDIMGLISKIASMFGG